MNDGTLMRSSPKNGMMLPFTGMRKNQKGLVLRVPGEQCSLGFENINISVTGLGLLWCQNCLLCFSFLDGVCSLYIIQYVKRSLSVTVTGEWPLRTFSPYQCCHLWCVILLPLYFSTLGSRWKTMHYVLSLGWMKRKKLTLATLVTFLSQQSCS